MKLKQKAGLALALAAIFTTAGANIALAADNVTDGGTVMNSTVNDTLTLVGATDPANVSFDGNNKGALNVIVPQANATLTIDNAFTLAGAGVGQALVGDANGNVINEVVATGDLSLAGGSGILNNLTIDGGTLAVADGNYNVTTLDLTNAGGTTTVGDSTANTVSLTLNNLIMGGNSIFVDPAWNNGVAAANLAIESFGAPTAGEPDSITIDGALIAGRNSHIILGQDNSNWMNRAVNSTGWWTTAGTGQVTSAFGVYGDFIVDSTTGNIVVDGSLSTVDQADAVLAGDAGATPPVPALGAGNVAFNNRSLFVVDASTLGANAALSSNGTTNTATIGGAGRGTDGSGTGTGAYLYIVNGRAGTTTQILDGFGGGVTVTNPGIDWNNGNNNTNIMFDNILLTGTGTLTDGGVGGAANDGTADGYAVTAAARDARAVMPINNSLANTLNYMMANGLNDVDSEFLDIRYVSRALSRMYGASDPANAARDAAMNIEGIAAAAAVAGVPYASYNIASTVSDIINGRASTLNRVASAAAGGPQGEWGIWLKPFYSYSDVDGLKVGKNDGRFETSYGGAVLGFDYNVHQDFNLGLAFNVGGGDTKSKGDFAETKSDFDFWGVTLYGAYTFGDWGIIGDVGYSSSSHDLTQRTNRTLGLPNLKGDVDTDAMSVGLTGEYVFRNQWGINIAPHLGVRWTSLKMDDYKMKARGLGDVVKSSMDRQNIWTIPVGVTFSNEYITSGGWMISPMMDMGLVVAAGDTDNDHKYNFVNLGSGTIDAEIVDDVAFSGLLGVKAKADNGFSIGIDYNIKASDNMTSHSFAGMLRYEF